VFPPSSHKVAVMITRESDGFDQSVHLTHCGQFKPHLRLPANPGRLLDFIIEHLANYCSLACPA